MPFSWLGCCFFFLFFFFFKLSDVTAKLLLLTRPSWALALEKCMLAVNWGLASLDLPRGQSPHHHHPHFLGLWEQASFFSRGHCGH